MTTLEKLEELIYRGFGETDRKFQETDREFKETALRFQETDRKFQETDRKFQEMVRESKEKADKFDETRRLFDQIAVSQKEAGRQLEELKQHVRGVTDSLGLFAESTVYAGAARLFRERGLELNEIGSRIRARYNGENMEFDVIASGPSAVLVIEVKLRLRQENVNRCLEKLETFFKFYPRYRGLTLFGVVGGMSIDAEVDRFAYNHGLFVLKLSEDNMQIWNDQNFVPRTWGASNLDSSQNLK